ncbi:unnamed protein product [Pylaiella littoralis]
MDADHHRRTKNSAWYQETGMRAFGHNKDTEKMDSKNAPSATTEVPRDETTLVSFSAEDVPVKAVTVYCGDKAEVTRVVHFSSPSSVGRHEVELRDLPGRTLIDKTSVRVKGSGKCTVLHVSYSDTQGEKDEAKVKQEKYQQDIQRLTAEYRALSGLFHRNHKMRMFANHFVEQIVPAQVVSDNKIRSVNDVDKVLHWWAAKMANTDFEILRLQGEERRLKDAITKLNEVREAAKKPPGRVSVTVDVQEPGPIDLEVKYMTRGATWSPSYRLRMDTQTGSMSCKYYGMVTQSTAENWEGVALRLSTTKPAVRTTPPPATGVKVVRCFCGIETAETAVAQWKSSGGGVGAVSFVIEKPADIKSNGQTKMLTVGIRELIAEVTHHVVPAKEPVAYLEAKVINNTDYFLLASDDVTLFLDNSFVAKTNINSVFPGESFQTFLGIDPAVKVTVAPPRITRNRRSSTHSKSNDVTHTRSTSISNKKNVPVTYVIVDAMPLSADGLIKVILKQPSPARLHEANVTTNDALVSTALEKFCGKTWHPAQAGTHLAGVIKSPSNQLAWIGKVAPQGEISIPLEYTVEWPTGQEIAILG